MNHRHSLAILMAASALLGGTAHGQSAGTQSAARVNVYQYAIDNPVGDSRLPIRPTLGETVPQSISLVPLDGDSTYAYFYWNGSPVIVDLTTRSVVRIGQ